ncbi:acyl-CoA desaturase [Nostoc sp. MG11]|uniref:acyl-CoA desaturase n=1 Tax=Nostoc sp. MG11 TaxID=2721166 RepID=UPI001867B990|nr:acyl-CoA desaturase [Nostoc sp. MG11]
MSMQLDRAIPAELLVNPSAKKSITIKSDYLRTPQRLHALALLWIPLVGSVAALAIAFYSGIGAVEIGLLVSMYILTLVGITVGFHRHFAHTAFQTSTAVRVILAILGSMACEGPITYWVSNHRRHHQYSDRPGDPHSPFFQESESLGGLRGLWHSHIGWMFKHEITNTFLFTKDLLRDPVISKVNQLYYVWALLGLAIPTILGGILTGTIMGAILGFLWGGCVRLFLIFHFTSSINSITHLCGSRPFDTKEHSRNNIWLAIPTGGEAWHNNHHAFSNSALFGLKWWQIDFGFYVIWVLEKVGLVWDVKKPTAQMIESKLKAKNN